MKPNTREYSDQTRAVIYARVSSIKQSTRGDGLGSQETRCREFARLKGLQVVEIFSDDMTGSLTSRPGMQAMLAYLRKHAKKEQIVVIIDDISRLARGIEAHLKLRTAIDEAGGILKSPSIEFGEDSDSILIENLLASVSQHQRDKNADQTVARMRARIQGGFWVFAAPIGYRYKRMPGHGNMLVKEEPYASQLTEALEGFASGRFETQVEVKRFLESCPEFPKDLPNGEIRNQRITEMLTRPVYAGFVEAPNWGVPRRKGHHEGLISATTFERNQERLNEKAKAPARKDINAEFPLRGFVCCADCHKPLTACYAKSSTGKQHPYYHCFTKGCPSARKSIPRAQIEGEFDALLQSLQPTQNLFDLARAMFENAWDQRHEQAVSASAHLKREMKEIAALSEKLLERIVETDNPSVITAYEKKIADLETRKLLIMEKLQNWSKPQYAFDDLFQRAMVFLSSPWNLWQTGQLHYRRLVLRLAFAERVPYRRGEGFSNVKTSLPFNVLGRLSMGVEKMARPKGFEPLTLRFVV